MTEQQQQLEDSSCAVDLSASALPDDKPEDKKDEVQDEVFTTTIEAIPEEANPKRPHPKRPHPKRPSQSLNRDLIASASVKLS